jgi:hypothetical protein
MIRLHSPSGTDSERDCHGRFAGVIGGADAGGTAFTDPVGIVVDWDGALYVLDDDGTRLTVQKFRLLLP